jgi:hypothetical protein
MDIDELASAIRATSTDPKVRYLSELLLKWKKDDSNVEHLQSSVEEYIENSLQSNEPVHKEVCRLWSKFRDDAILGIHGMTMNERLYCFNLFARYDSAWKVESKHAIYAKLLAKP